MWKSTIINPFDRKIRESAYHDRKLEFYEIGNQVRSNLALQMALYFNVWLFPAWLLVGVLSFDAKYHSLTDAYKVLTIAVFIVLSMTEGLRLYLGYLGNLGGKIPELASFWLISALIQFPLEMFLLWDSGTLPRISEMTVNSLMAFLLVIEIVTGTVTLKNLADRRAKRFYLAQLYGIEDPLNRR